MRESGKGHKSGYLVSTRVDCMKALKTVYLERNPRKFQIYKCACELTLSEGGDVNVACVKCIYVTHYIAVSPSVP